MLDFEHKHRCAECRLVWEHDPGTGVGLAQPKRYRPPSRGLSHFCPGCGGVELQIYEGPEAVNVSHYAAWTRPQPGVGHGQTVGARV